MPVAIRGLFEVSDAPARYSASDGIPKDVIVIVHL